MWDQIRSDQIRSHVFFVPFDAQPCMLARWIFRGSDHCSWQDGALNQSTRGFYDAKNIKWTLKSSGHLLIISTFPLLDLVARSSHQMARMTTTCREI
ncbi:MAG: hypothetical protein CL912_31380 [Deltaproteobacteria bacterium]|nr:hypothetical protein [Deltaproteobacteria bacterium]